MVIGMKPTLSCRSFSRRGFIAWSLKTMGGLSLAGWERGLLSVDASDGTSSGHVATLKGLVSAKRLGRTLMHEHILFGNIPAELRAASIDFAVKLLEAAAKAGIETLVDLTPFRDIQLYREVAARTKIKIVASTGFYLRNRVPAWMAEMDDEKQMEERMTREVVEGIDGSGIRAGMIKVAAGNTPYSDWEKKVYQAAARVQKALGTPIATHAVDKPREQFDLLVKAGANPKRLFFSHVETVAGWGGRDRNQMLQEYLSIAREGGYLLFNNFGQNYYTPWDDMLFLMRAIFDQGHGNHLLISIDCNWEWKKEKIVFEAEDEPFLDPNASKRTYAYMMTDVVPAMLKAGFSKKEMDLLLIHNPRQFFS
jgi:phosphotriesterase-related protein